MFNILKESEKAEWVCHDRHKSLNVLFFSLTENMYKCWNINRTGIFHISVSFSWNFQRKEEDAYRRSASERDESVAFMRFNNEEECILTASEPP